MSEDQRTLYPEVPWTQDDEDAADRAMDRLVAAGDVSNEDDPTEGNPDTWDAEDAERKAFIAQALREYGEDGDQQHEEPTA